MVAGADDQAVGGRDPVLSNLRITLTHQQLSLSLRQLIGESGGANFHTWAVWGSKTAGRTIRHEDLPVPMRVVTPAATLAGAGAAAVMRVRRGPGRARRHAVSIAAGAGVGGGLGRGVRRLADRAAHSIFGGNATVLDDIGRQTARFLFAAGSDDAFEAFEAQLRPGPPETGGQDLLRGAYRHYREASRATDPDHRDS